MSRKNSFSICLAVLLAGCLHSSLRADEASGAEYLSDSLSARIGSVTQGWGQFGLNVSAAATPASAVKLKIGNKEYAHGLGHHANGEINVELDEQFKTFQADLGVFWQGGKSPASVIFRIYADDKKVFDSGVMHENDAPRPVSVSVEDATDLRLAVEDAGDGIGFDAVVWGDARLTRNPNASKKPRAMGVDISPFGKVYAWDPKAMEGTKANRVQDLPAEDIYPGKELARNENGVYSVPVTDGVGCIGLQWDENRLLRQVALQFSEANVPPVESIQLQYWTGESAWQGKWQPVDIKPEKIENRLAWTFGYQAIPTGTQKVRWIISNAQSPVVVKNLSAYTRSRWKTVAVRLESTGGKPQTAEIEVFNGELESNTAGKTPYRCSWDTSKPLSLKVRTSAAEQFKVDRTVLRIRMPEAAFGIAVEDLLSNDCVYVPSAKLFATREPAPITAADYLKKIASQKTMLAEVRELPDQDFNRAWKAVHNPVQDICQTMLSLANDNRKYVVSREGSVFFDEYDGGDDPRWSPTDTIYNIPFAAPWRFTPVFGSGNAAKTSRSLQGDWLPIVVNTADFDAAKYRQTTYVAPTSEPTADAPWWYRDRAIFKADYKIEGNSEEASAVQLALHFAHTQQKAFQVQPIEEGYLVVQGDHVLALIDTRKAKPLAVKQEAYGVSISGNLAGRGSAECSVSFPGWKVDPKDYAQILKSDATVAATETYWKKLLEPAMQIDVPEKMLNDLIRASQVHCMLAGRNEKRGELVSAWTAAVLYGPLESESNAVIRGMDMLGQPDFARRGLEFLIKRGQNKEGFITTGYTLVGTGEVLWTLAEHYDRTRDREWLKKVAPDVVRACQWIIRNRAKTQKLDASGQKVPEYGLMPPAVSADWNRFAFRFFNDAQYYAGLKMAGDVLADIGDPAAKDIQKDAQAYRQDILRAYRTARAKTPVVKLNDGTWVPGDPSILQCLGRVEDYLPGEDVGRTWAYSIELGGHQLFATEVLDPASKEAEWSFDYLEDVQYFRTGMGDYPEKFNREDPFSRGGFGKVQPYYGRTIDIYAMRDEVKPFVRAYFNPISSLVNIENLSISEHFNNHGAWNKTHETGWFLSQSRIMLVNERGDDLWLAPFVTTHWMKDGMKTSVRNAPTRFGKVGFEIVSNAAQGEIEAVVRLPKDCTAKNVILRLRHPDGKPIKSVTVQGKPHKNFDPKNDTITLAPSEETITVVARY